MRCAVRGSSVTQFEPPLDSFPTLSVLNHLKFLAGAVTELADCFGAFGKLWTAASPALDPAFLTPLLLPGPWCLPIEPSATQDGAAFTNPLGWLVADPPK